MSEDVVLRNIKNLLATEVVPKTFSCEAKHYSESLWPTLSCCFNLVGWLLYIPNYLEWGKNLGYCPKIFNKCDFLEYCQWHSQPYLWYSYLCVWQWSCYENHGASQIGWNIKYRNWYFSQWLPSCNYAPSFMFISVCV